jgi:hypothetical protein
VTHESAQKTMADMLLITFDPLDVQDLVKIQFGWDVRKYPLTDYPPQISTDGFPYRILNYTINMVQGPAHVEFTYSVDGRSRGVAASVEYSKFCR